MTTPDRIEASYRNLERINGWIANAETKAGAVFGVAAILFGLVLARFDEALRRTLHPSLSIAWLTALCLVVAGFFLLISICKTIAVYRPSLKAPTKSIFFFGSIAKMSRAEFTEQMRQIDPEGIEAELIQQSHVNAGIALRKFKNVRGAIDNLLLGSVLLLVHVVGRALLAGD